MTRMSTCQLYELCQHVVCMESINRITWQVTSIGLPDIVTTCQDTWSQNINITSRICVQTNQPADERPFSCNALKQCMTFRQSMASQWLSCNALGEWTPLCTSTSACQWSPICHFHPKPAVHVWPYIIVGAHSNRIVLLCYVCHCFSVSAWVQALAHHRSKPASANPRPFALVPWSIMLRIGVVGCLLTFMFVVNHQLVPIGINRPVCVWNCLLVYVLGELFFVYAFNNTIILQWQLCR
jgi:hypothetical protein